MKKQKKAQLKIQQMSFMLIAVFVFFAIVALIYLVMQTAGIKAGAENLEIERIAGMATRLSSTPEFNFNGKANSVDVDKLMVLKSQSYKKTYSEFLGVKGVRIQRVYPNENNFENLECTLSNYPNCDTITLFNMTSKSTAGSSSAFVALCRKQTIEGNPFDKCELGRIAIEVNNMD